MPKVVIFHHSVDAEKARAVVRQYRQQLESKKSQEIIAWPTFTTL